MKNILENIFEVMFSFPALLIVSAIAFIYYANSGIDAALAANRQAEEHSRQLNEFCYNQGLILVDTAAGQRCADPRTLVKVK